MMHANQKERDCAYLLESKKNGQTYFNKEKLFEVKGQVKPQDLIIRIQLYLLNKLFA